MTDRRFLLVVNDKAGGATTRTRLERLRQQHPTFADSSLVAPFRDLDDIRNALAGAQGRIPVAVGGDGTVNLVARLNREQGEPAPVLGVIPMGTGNLLAHDLGISSVNVALSALTSGQPRARDAMETTREDFPLSLMSISTGFEAAFIRTYDEWRGRLGRPAGALAGLSRLLAFGSRGARIDLDGTPFLNPETRFFCAGLYSMKSFAFGIKTYPDAIADDGLGEGVIYGSRLPYVASLVRGRRYEQGGSPTYKRWRLATVESQRPVQIDGESVPGGTFQVTMVPKALHLLAPPG